MSNNEQFSDREQNMIAQILSLKDKLAAERARVGQLETALKEIHHVVMPGIYHNRETGYDEPTWPTAVERFIYEKVTAALASTQALTPTLTDAGGVMEAAKAAYEDLQEYNVWIHKHADPYAAPELQERALKEAVGYAYKALNGLHGAFGT